jgi:hypothetical protein
MAHLNVRLPTGVISERTAPIPRSGFGKNNFFERWAGLRNGGYCH